MLPELMTGTRKRQNFMFGHPPAERFTQSFTRDVGMTKNVTASITFVAASKQAQAGGGTFANFAVGDFVFVEGTNLNNGFATVTATDASTFLTLDNGATNEGPLTATIRTV